MNKCYLRVLQLSAPMDFLTLTFLQYRHFVT